MLVLSLVLIGLAITLEPIPLTAFILILASQGGVRKGAGFIFGWLVSLAVVVTATVLLTGNNPPKPNTNPSLAALAAKLAIGVGLVVIAIRYYRKLGKPKPPKSPPNGRPTSQHDPVVRHGPRPAHPALGTHRRRRDRHRRGEAVLLGGLPGPRPVLRHRHLLDPGHGDLRRVPPQPAQDFLTRSRHWIDTHTDQVIVIVSLVLGFWLVAGRRPLTSISAVRSDLSGEWQEWPEQAGIMPGQVFVV